MVVFLVHRGGPTLGTGLLFGDSPPLGAILGRVLVWEGIWPACVGTLLLVGMATIVAVPLGIASGIHLAVYARGWSRGLLCAAIDLLAGTPSVVMGLFGFMTILFLRRSLVPGAAPGLLLAASCLALLVLPYVVSTTRASIKGLPESIRLAGPSLGLTRWQSAAHVLVPAGSRGIVGGVVLAVGRAAEDTAVILLTGVVANAGLPRGPGDRFRALPFEVYYVAAQHQTQDELARGFGAALVLLCLTGALVAAAHLLHWSLERRWTQGA
jgi:phosphate transport system permease protein